MWCLLVDWGCSLLTPLRHHRGLTQKNSFWLALQQAHAHGQHALAVAKTLNLCVSCILCAGAGAKWGFPRHGSESGIISHRGTAGKAAQKTLPGDHMGIVVVHGPTHDAGQAESCASGAA